MPRRSLLTLSEREVNAIIAFLQTLTDGYQFQEQATFSDTKGTVKIPYLRTEGLSIKLINIIL